MKKFSKLKIVALLVLTMVSVSVFTVYALPKAVDVSDDVNYISTAVSEINDNDMVSENNKTDRFQCFKFKSFFDKILKRYEIRKHHNETCKKNKNIEVKTREYERCCAMDKYGNCSKYCIYEKPKEKEVCCSFDKYGNCSKRCIIEEPKVKHSGKTKKGNSINNEKDNVIAEDGNTNIELKTEKVERCCAWDQYGNCSKVCVVND